MPESISADSWLASRDYLYGVDLYNHAYWWEAHEAWEGLWHATGRSGAPAEYFKGLIKCAAAHLKVEQDRMRGAGNLQRQAIESLKSVRRSLGPRIRFFMGLDVGEFTRAIQKYFAPLLDEGRAPDPAAGFPRIVLWP